MNIVNVVFKLQWRFILLEMVQLICLSSSTHFMILSFTSNNMRFQPKRSERNYIYFVKFHGNEKTISLKDASRKLPHQKIGNTSHPEY